MSAKTKKFPLFLVLLVAFVLGGLGYYSYKQSLESPAPIEINLVGNGITPEITDGPASIPGVILKSDQVGEEGTFVLISRTSGALYELDIKGIDELVGSLVLVDGTVFMPTTEFEAPILYVSSLTPLDGI